MHCGLLYLSSNQSNFMALSRIWGSFLIIALLFSLYSLFSNDNAPGIFQQMVSGKNGDTIRMASNVQPIFSSDSVVLQRQQVELQQQGWRFEQNGQGNGRVYRLQKADGLVETCQTAVALCLKLIGFLAFFMGLLSIAEQAGGIRFLSRLIGPFFSRIFPEVPKGHPAMGHMMMNFSANLLGLDNAATPFGLKAMESLQELNPDKTKATNAQIMFLCLHASGLTLVPISIIALRSAAKAANPMDIFIPCMIATFAATIAAMSIVAIRQRIRLLDPVILAWVLGISGLIALLILYMHSLSSDQLTLFSGSLSSGLILLIMLIILLGGWYKKIDLFDAFVSGAKGGFETAIRIIPYLVGMLVAISMLRTSGCFDWFMEGVRQLVTGIGVDAGFVDALPTAIMKPFSGAGARGLMVDTMRSYGPDSFAGRLACVLQGSSDTTFYVIAVYYGAVSIRNTRYTVGAMLLADLVGVITAILLAYAFFGGGV
jgi:spore maturation protein SpmA/spore maturation protein SpmB